MTVQVEVCVSSIAEARCAAAAGVDGIEVCAWPACGGVTPSLGLLELIGRSLDIPLRVLVRPGPGGFAYGGDESEQMLADCRRLVSFGVHGLVVGALDPSGIASLGFLRSARAIAAGRELTFHRAIDQANDPLAVMEQCIEVGVDRVLTSGGSARAVAGVQVLAQLVQRAGRLVVVAAAGGIGPDNVVEVVERTGVREVHFAAWRVGPTPAALVPMSSSDASADRPLLPDRAKIEGVLNALDKAGLR